MKSALFLALACALVSPVAAQAASAPAGPANAEAARLNVARSGNDVMITWELPPIDIKQFEIFRNSHKDTKGRGRAAAIRTEPAIFLDQVPDQAVTYWYWLKITLRNGQVLNIGPVATPDPDVWTP
jgi:hypothetical protein